MLKKKGVTTEVEMYQGISCFQIPLANGSLPGGCGYAGGSVYFDPGSSAIGLPATMADILEQRFLSSCSKIPLRSSSALQFACDETVKLPRLTITSASWDFFLDPADYTTPSTNSSTTTGKQVNVLIGQADTMYRGILVLGAPFLRKFPINFNDDTNKITVYCAENSTCAKVPPPPLRTYSPSSGTSGGGGGGGYGVDVDVEASRKRKKLYVGIGLGVAGVAILALFGYCCKSNETTEEDAKNEEDVELEVTVEQEKTGSTSSEKTVSGAVKAEPNRKKADSERDSDNSSGYDSEGSEEERRVLRELRERRRRRKEKEAKRPQASGVDGSKATTTGETSTQEGFYVAAETPKGKRSEL